MLRKDILAPVFRWCFRDLRISGILPDAATSQLVHIRKAGSSCRNGDGLFLTDRFQVAEADFEMAAEHPFHVQKNGEELQEIAIGGLHGPGNGGAVAGGFQFEGIGVVSVERLSEVDLDLHAMVRNRFGDGHVPLAGAASAGPIGNGARAVGSTAESSDHGGVLLVLGRPLVPIMEVVDDQEHLVGRGIDGDGALDPQGAGFGSRVEEQQDEQGEDEESDTQRNVPLLAPIAAQSRCYACALLDERPRQPPGLCRFWLRSAMVMMGWPRNGRGPRKN